MVVRTTVWAFIYVIEHTKTKGGGVKKYAHQVGRPERVRPQIQRPFIGLFLVVSKCTQLGTQRNGTIFMKRYGYHRTSIKERHLDQGIADVYSNLIWVIWFIKKQ